MAIVDQNAIESELIGFVCLKQLQNVRNNTDKMEKYRTMLVIELIVSSRFYMKQTQMINIHYQRMYEKSTI